MLMVMPPNNQVPPAPPPYQPNTAGHDPYDFINNPAQPAKKRLIPGGDSKKSKLITIGVGAVVLVLLALVAGVFISSRGSGVKNDYLTLVQQQAELIRISDIGTTKASQSEAKNLAITTKLTLSSQQTGLLKLAKKAGASTDAKSLALGKDTKTDTLLKTAEQTNQFDSALIKNLRTGLKKYQATLKKLHDASSSKSTKTTLAKDYQAVGLLISTQ